MAFCGVMQTYDYTRTIRFYSIGIPYVADLVVSQILRVRDMLYFKPEKIGIGHLLLKEEQQFLRPDISGDALFDHIKMRDPLLLNVAIFGWYKGKYIIVTFTVGDSSVRIATENSDEADYQSVAHNLKLVDVWVNDFPLN